MGDAGFGDEEWATAVHEAGHAVVGKDVGVRARLLEVSIEPDEGAGRLGHTLRGDWPLVPDQTVDAGGAVRRVLRPFNPECDDRRLGERLIAPHVAMLLAGELAERRVAGSRLSQVASSSDSAMALSLIEYLADSPRDANRRAEERRAVAAATVEEH